jgi:DNA-directed RNA polymerase specialized sigma24 family protein
MSNNSREDLNAALDGFSSGRYGVGEMLRRSRPYWEATARMLMRRWRCPEGVEVSDIVQELMMAAYDSLGTYDAARGNLRSYVIFSACDRAKKWIHKQRLGSRPHRDEDRTPSRNVRPFSRWARAEDDDQLRDMPYEAERACLSLEDGEPATVAILAVRESWERARQHSPTYLSPALDAVLAAHGDIEAAAKDLYDSKRLQCRLGCFEEARHLVRLSVDWVTTMVQIDADSVSVMG